MLKISANQYATLSTEKLDEMIGSTLDPINLDRLLHVRALRATVLDAVLRLVRADIERATIFDGTDPYVDFSGEYVMLVAGGVTYDVRGPTTEAIAANIRYRLTEARERAYPAPGVRRLRLTGPQAFLVADEIERMQGETRNPRVSLRGPMLTGFGAELLELAEGIAATTSDEDLLALAFSVVADGTEISRKAFEVRARFAFKSMKRSRNALLSLLRGPSR